MPEPPLTVTFYRRENFKTILTETRKKYELQSSNSLLKIEGEVVDRPELRILLFDARRIVLNAKVYLPKLSTGTFPVAHLERIINVRDFS